MIDLTVFEKINIKKISAPKKYRLDRLDPNNVEEISSGIRRLIQIIAVKIINRGQGGLIQATGDVFEAVAYHMIELIKDELLLEQEESEYTFSDDEYLTDLYISSVNTVSRYITVEVVVKDQLYAFDISFEDRR